jgi:beta-fructofuranosidase
MKEQLHRAEQGVAALLAERDDRWYPTFHIAAAAGWINDPNGLSFFDGRYQVYFQHHPYSPEWGPMHWGHVSSEDMVTWRREPIALAPSIEADRDGVFSGSAVVSDDGRLFAYYTGHRWRNGVNEDEGNLQVQCYAVSDDAVSFEKKGVIVECPDGLLHFRDPKVWRTGDAWYMVFGACSADKRGQVWLYTSADMENWEFDRVLFEDPDPDAFMLECPDMFPLGDRWVLFYCPMGPEPSGYQARNGHNAGYVVGTWEPGEEFEQLTDFRPIDWGHQYYAPQTLQAPDGRRIAYAWMGSFTLPIATQRADGWCGQFTVPRELRLDADNRLWATPIRELTRLRTRTMEFGSFVLGVNEDRVLVADGEAVEIELKVDLAATTSERVGLKVHATPDGGHTFVHYDDLARRVTLDRRTTGHGDRGYRSAPYTGGDELTLRVLVDRGSVEVFVNDGLETLTSFSFPGEGPRAVVLTSESGTVAVDSLDVHRLGTIWAEPDR